MKVHSRGLSVTARLRWSVPLARVDTVKEPTAALTRAKPISSCKTPPEATAASPFAMAHGFSSGDPRGVRGGTGEAGEAGDTGDTGEAGEAGEAGVGFSGEEGRSWPSCSISRKNNTGEQGKSC